MSLLDKEPVKRAEKFLKNLDPDLDVELTVNKKKNGNYEAILLKNSPN